MPARPLDPSPPPVPKPRARGPAPHPAHVRPPGAPGPEVDLDATGEARQAGRDSARAAPATRQTEQ